MQMLEELGEAHLVVKFLVGRVVALAAKGKTRRTPDEQNADGTQRAQSTRFVLNVLTAAHVPESRPNHRWDRRGHSHQPLDVELALASPFRLDRRPERFCWGGGEAVSFLEGSEICWAEGLVVEGCDALAVGGVRDICCRRQRVEPPHLKAAERQ